MFLNAIIFAVSSAAVVTVAPGPEVVLFPPGKVPGERPGVFPPKEYWHRGAVSNVTIPTLTPYLVPNATTAVVIAPGGAYKWLTWGEEGTDVAAWLNSIGVSAFILKYRVPARSWLPFGGAPIMDAQRALGVIRQNASQFGLNATSLKLGIIGFSAGSHLSAHLSTDFETRAYPKVDAADNLSCRPDFTMLCYPWCVVGDNSQSGASCNSDTNHTMTLNVQETTPSMFIVQAEDDPVHVDNALLLYLALKHAKTPPSELHVYPVGGHGFGLCHRNEEVCSWPLRAAEYMVANKFIAPANASS